MFNNIFFYSHPGKRKHQEDSYSFDSTFILVADGVGGLARGEVASNIVSEFFQKKISESVPSICNLEAWVQNAIQELLNFMNDTADQNPDLDGMGSTLALVINDEENVFAIHVGDTRIYHFGKTGKIKWKSRDHSLVQDLVDAGIITAEQSRIHPKKNVITRVLKADRNQYTQASAFHLKDVSAGDIILICSDGVLEFWDDQKLEQLIGLSIDNEKIVTMISQSATSIAGDNNTAVLGTIIFEF